VGEDCTDDFIEEVATLLLRGEIGISSSAQAVCKIDAAANANDVMMIRRMGRLMIVWKNS